MQRGWVQQLVSSHGCSAQWDRPLGANTESGYWGHSYIPDSTSDCHCMQHCRTTGRSQRSYAVHEHYIHCQYSPKSICSLEHLPKKEPQDLVRYATGKHTAASVQLMAVQATSNLDVSKGELWQSILQIVNVTTTCCPENDNTWPSRLRMILCRAGTVQQLCSTSRAYPGLIQGLLLFSKALKCCLTIRSVST